MEYGDFVTLGRGRKGEASPKRSSEFQNDFMDRQIDSLSKS